MSSQPTTPLCDGAGPEEDYDSLTAEDFLAAEEIRNSTLEEE